MKLARLVLAVGLMLPGTVAGCRRPVQAPLTVVAPVPGQPELVWVDQSKPEQRRGARTIPTAEDAIGSQRVIQVAEGVSAAMLQRRPVGLAYPVEAKERHLTGKVVFRAIVGADGTVKGLTVLESADPVLVPAAIASVGGWQYRPFLLNGRPVAVDTRITVNFMLSP